MILKSLNLDQSIKYNYFLIFGENDGIKESSESETPEQSAFSFRMSAALKFRRSIFKASAPISAGIRKILLRRFLSLE